MPTLCGSPKEMNNVHNTTLNLKRWASYQLEASGQARQALWQSDRGLAHHHSPHLESGDLICLHVSSTTTLLKVYHPPRHCSLHTLPREEFLDTDRSNAHGQKEGSQDYPVLYP